MFIAYVQRFYLPVFCTVGLLVYLAQYYSFSIPELVNNYLNDFLCMPIVLKLCQYAVRFIKSDDQLKIPLKISALHLRHLYAVYFEWVLPQFISRYTADRDRRNPLFLGIIVFLMDRAQYVLTAIV